MSAEIIDLAGKRPVPRSGNGAREAAVGFWLGYAGQNGISTDGWAAMMADNMLGFLWNEGFKVVPLDTGDHEYEGPDWTGEERPV